MTRIRIPTAVLTLSLAGCHGPSPTQPVTGGGEVRVDVDVWDGTRWRQLFREAKHLGERVKLSPAGESRDFEVLPVDPRPLAVYSTPTCSVADDPGTGEVRSYLDCLAEKLRGDAMNHVRPSWPLDEERPTHLLTWHEDTGMWNVWTVFWSRCGNAYRDMTEAGLIRAL